MFLFVWDPPVIVSSKTLWQTPVLLESADRHDPQGRYDPAERDRH